MGNQSAHPRGFNVAPSKPPSPGNANATSNNALSPQTAAIDNKNMTTNDFLDDMLQDIDKTKQESTNNKQDDITTNLPKYILKKKIIAYNTNDFDNILTEVGGQIDAEYDSTSTSNSHSNLKTSTSSSPSSKSNHRHNNTNNKQLYVEQLENMKSIFKYKKQLGKGGTCRVLLVEKRSNTNTKSKEKYALKELSKNDKYNEELFAKEIQLLRLLTDNRHVVDYYAAYQTKHYFYLATAYCGGGTFLDRVLEMKTFSEKTAIKYIYTILSAVQYMHSKNIVHRDIKLNNMVFDKKGDEGILKIIDFGDSDIVEENKTYRELVGTLYYLSPECRKSRKGWEVKKSDMWAIGVMSYILLTGKLPFSGDTQQKTIKLIEKAKYVWPENAGLSAACKSFIDGLLCKNTKKRMSAEKALKHEWIADYEHTANDINLLDKIKTFLRDFNYQNKLHKILVNACLEEIDDKERKVVIEAFHTIDIENKGNINEGDICRYLVLNSKINKKYNENNSAENHAKHIFSVIENGTKMGPQIIKSKSIAIDEFVSSVAEEENLSLHDNNTSNDNDNEHEDDSKYIDENDSDDEELGDDPGQLMPISSNSEVNNFQGDTGLQINDNISVTAFKDIMSKSPKKYPVNDLVNDLDPNNTGFISFQSISKFSKQIKTISLDHDHSSNDMYGDGDDDDANDLSDGLY